MDESYIVAMNADETAGRVHCQVLSPVKLISSVNTASCCSSWITLSQGQIVFEIPLNGISGGSRKSSTSNKWTSLTRNAAYVPRSFFHFEIGTFDLNAHPSTPFYRLPCPCLSHKKLNVLRVLCDGLERYIYADSLTLTTRSFPSHTLMSSNTVDWIELRESIRGQVLIRDVDPS